MPDIVHEITVSLVEQRSAFIDQEIKRLMDENNLTPENIVESGYQLVLEQGVATGSEEVLKLKLCKVEKTVTLKLNYNLNHDDTN